MNEDNITESINDFLENNDAENETIIRMDDDTELFINNTDEEEEDEENGAGYVMQPPFKKTGNKIKIYALTGLLSIFTIIVIGLFLDKGKTPGPILSGKQRIEMKDVFKLRPSKNPVYWFDSGEDGTVIQVSQKGDIELFNIISKEVKIVASMQDLMKGNNKINLGFELSKDTHYLIIPTFSKTVFRHSKIQNYVVFDCKAKKYLDFKNELNNISNIEFSPSSDKIAYVKNNNMYYLNLKTGKSVQITNDGSKNIFNGISDWVYEEEVLMSSKAFWWSPDGKYLGFIKFNDTNVPEYEIPVYLDNNLDGISYNAWKSIKYPKPGFPNPDVNVYIYDTTKETRKKNNLKKVVYEKDYEFQPDNLVILQVLWATEDSKNLLIRTSNRVQDTARLFSVNIPHEIETESDITKEKGTFIATFLKEDDHDDDGWLTRTESIYFVPPNGYIEIMEDKNGYEHINYYPDIYDEKSMFLTSGEWEVDSISGIDKNNKIIYYISTEEGSMQKHLYKVNLNGQRNIKMTPPVSEIEEQKEIINSFGENLSETGVFSASFSPGFNFYLLNYDGPNIPYQKILSTQDSYDDFHIDLSNNELLEKALSNYDIPKFHRFEIPINDYTVNALAIYPPDFDENSPKKYPVLFHPYGGPNSQMATYNYQFDFDSVLASDPEHPMIVVIVDGRGTALKGRKFRVSVAKQLGKLEAEDQIKAAQYLQKLPYVDEDKFAIWGWSYGGYLTSKVVEANSGVFKVAMAVAPVIDWKFYDTLYTERYMKTLKDNIEGYKQSAINNVEGFKNVDFLLVHGTGDGKIHFQNSALLVSKLTLKGVNNYTVQFYTDNDHSMVFGNAYSQLMNLLTEFLHEHLFKEKKN
ncbi:hypothetical protein BCR36DRAFT_336342 [Piromyces finnis]|uniref:Dipeptidyl-peptidase IV n=1 Tax=Piromyces finnis TaxID=1754191 RepID=A0A1Y1V0E7_9FUNG|nr:hypothetical protein BCR36DRAFT_336342 [Piromyces finnis]|eukprot:ORX43292.1 hypothetical protein BCR36DRAFT_336342 [Piromyces finnis]